MKQQEWDKRKEQYRKILGREPAWAETAAEVCNITGNETACYVLAPVLCHYVAWVLGKALRLGKKRVYFLARDGFQMYHIAEIFCKRLELPLECRYLYCSRYALRKAEYMVVPERMYDYLCLDGLHVTLEMVFQRAGVKDRKEQERYAGLLGMKEYLPARQKAGVPGEQQTEEQEAGQRSEKRQERMPWRDRQLGYRELQELKPRLQACRPFDEQQKQRAERAYANAIGYFTQEGLLDGTPYLLADSGWSGTMQQTIRWLLESAGQDNGNAENRKNFKQNSSFTVVEGCYFGLYELPEDADRTKYHTWFFSPESGLSRKVNFNNNVFECICTSTEGMCVGYRKDEAGIYRPRLSSKENPNRALSRALLQVFTVYAEKMSGLHPEELEKAIKEEIHAGKGRNTGGKRFLRTAEQLLTLFMGNPTQEEAEVYGSFVFCDDVIGEENQYLAATLEKDEIRKNHLLGQLRRRFGWGLAKSSKEETEAAGGAKNSAWMEASVAIAYPAAERRNPMSKAFGYGAELWHCHNVKRVRYARKQWKAQRKKK